MPRRLPPPHPRGQPRTPGSGRRRGSLNRRTVELRQLMTALVGDVSYQHRLRDDFRRRRVHPSTEAVVWAYAIGRPAEKIELAARVATEAKIADERAIYERLTSAQLAELAAASEAVRDRAVAMLMSNRG